MGNFESKTPGSRKLFERAKKVLPGGVSYAMRALVPYPFFVKKAHGAKLTDVDGNIFTDYWVGHGALILGHSPKRVMDAVRRQIPNGTHIGLSHGLEVEMAERICSLVPSAEMLRYCASGTEANMYCVRLARAYTGRTGVVKMQGGWHGGYDGLHKGVTYPYNISESAGLLPATNADTTAIPYNDLEAARKELWTKKYALLIVEPVLGAAGFITPEPGYLQGLREACTETGTLLAFDEVITGFRLAPGGGQELYGVKPDLTTLGKIMGGGFPVGALCGRADILEHIDHNKYKKPQERSAHGGTFTGNPITLTAGLATLDLLKDGKVYIDIDRLGHRMREGLVDTFERNRVAADVTGVGSVFAVHYQKGKVRNAGDTARNDMPMTQAYFAHMLDNNILYLSPNVSHCWLSSAHTREDVDAYLSATEEFVKGYKP